MNEHKDKSWLVQKYWDESLSMRQIAQLVNIDHSLIRYWMDKFNIPCRTRSQALTLNNGMHGKLGRDHPCYKHGERQRGRKWTKLYMVWLGMKQRCSNPKHKSYKIYGQRNIQVCAEWINNYDAFRRWAGNTDYKPGLTIDRIDNEEGYFPKNCRWVTRAENTKHKRSI